MQFKSKEQLDEEQKFSLLLQDDYELIVTNLEPAIRDKYMAKADKDGKIPQEEIINVTLEVVACKDGSAVVDEEGKEAQGRKVFFTIRPESMGFKREGTPSKSRSFVAFATGQDVNGALDLADWNDLIGKTLYAEVVQYKNQKGQIRNKIERFVNPPKKGKKSTKKNPSMEEEVEEIKEEDIPIIGGKAESEEGVDVKDIPF